MSEWKAAIIVGTGASALGLGHAEDIAVPTRFGDAKLAHADLDGSPVLLLARHGAGHRVPPHRINYRANAEALRVLGCERCFATAAVGSLRDDWPAQTIAVPHDLLDLSGRNLTVHEDEVVHTDFTHPFDEDLRTRLLDACPSEAKREAVYVNANGPRFESPAEVRMMRLLGGDVVGMTAGTEAIVMRETGIRYALICAVTNLASGVGTAPVDHSQVYQQMKQSMGVIAATLRAAISTL
ncbi:MAG: MTAP family purine nucleoside phosphorylase [Fimbriimonadia bacterium]|jgi:5'-methylthioadenosine phosphorylase